MSNVKVEQSVLAIVEALKARDQKEITGAVLGELVRRVAPDLNLRTASEVHSGPGALTKFVDMHLSELLKKIRRQGPDWVYLISAGNQLDLETLPTIWQEFVRPNSPNFLILHDANAQVKARVSVQRSVESNAIEIKSATSEELNKLRFDFTKTLNAKLAESSDQTLDAKLPYPDWSTQLKNIGAEHYRNWTEFRINGIVNLFDSRLSEKGIDSNHRAELCKELRSSQSASRFPLISKYSVQSETRHGRELMTHGSHERSMDLQSAVINAVKSLSESELRELRLPVGALFDALIGLNKNSQR